MTLKELVESYYLHTGGSKDYIGDITDSDGNYSFLIEGKTLCTVSEIIDDETDEYNVCINASLNDCPDDKSLLSLCEDYGYKLRCSPLFQIAYIKIPQQNQVGLACEISINEFDEKIFCKLMDLFVATVQFLLNPDDDDTENEAEEIFDRLFVPASDSGYRKLLKECGIDADALHDNYDTYTMDDGFVSRIYCHEMTGFILIENAFECEDAYVALSLLYLNGILPGISCLEYRAGAIYLVYSLNPERADREQFSDALLTQRYLSQKLSEYIANESKHVEELNIREIMTAVFA